MTQITDAAARRLFDKLKIARDAGEWDVTARSLEMTVTTPARVVVLSNYQPAPDFPLPEALAGQLVEFYYGAMDSIIAGLEADIRDVGFDPDVDINEQLQKIADDKAATEHAEAQAKADAEAVQRKITEDAAQAKKAEEDAAEEARMAAARKLREGTPEE